MTTSTSWEMCTCTGSAGKRAGDPPPARGPHGLDMELRTRSSLPPRRRVGALWARGHARLACGERNPPRPHFGSSDRALPALANSASGRSARRRVLSGAPGQRRDGGLDLSAQNHRLARSLGGGTPGASPPAAARSGTLRAGHPDQGYGGRGPPDGVGAGLGSQQRGERAGWGSGRLGRGPRRRLDSRGVAFQSVGESSLGTHSEPMLHARTVVAIAMRYLAMAATGWGVSASTSRRAPSRGSTLGGWLVWPAWACWPGDCSSHFGAGRRRPPTG